MSRRNTGKKWTTLISLSIVCLCMALVFAFAQQVAREFILKLALDRIASALPATLEIGDARWSDLESISLEGVSLQSGGDTLAAADRLDLSVRLSPLLRRDLHIRSIEVEGIVLDFPRLRAAFAPETETDSSGRGGFSLLREGAVAPMPSAVLDNIRLSGSRLRIGEGREVVDFHFAASAENRAGQVPEFVLHELHLRDQEGTWQIEKTAAVVRQGVPLKADVLIGIAPENRLSLEVEEERTGTYRIALREAGAAPAAPAILEGVVERSGPGDTSPIRFTMNGRVPGTERLCRYAPIEPYLKNVPELNGMPFNVDGHWFPITGSGELLFRSGSNGWIESSGAVVSWEKDRIYLDSLEISIDDLLAEGSFHIHEGEAAGRCRFDMRGSRWLSPLLPSGADAPPHLRGEILLETAGKIDSLRTRALLVLSEIGAAPAIRQLRVEARHSADDGAIHATVEAETDRNRIDFAASINASLTDLFLGPIRIFESESPRAGPPAIGAKPGRIRIDRRKEIVNLLMVQLTGDYGRCTVQGFASRTGGELHLGASWSRPPAAMLRRMQPALRDRLLQLWPDGPPPRVDGSLQFDEGETGWQAAAEMKFDLPGLSIFSPALPPEASERLVGELAVDGTALTGDRRISGNLSVRPEGWIDTVAARVFVDGDIFGIDSASVALRGLQVRAEGAVVQDSLRLHCSYEIATEAIRLILPDKPPVDSLLAIGELRITGTTKSPVALLSFKGNADGSSFTADSFEGEVRLADGSIEGEFQTEVRSPAGPIQLDFASAAWQGPSTPPYLPAHLTIEASGQDLRLALDSDWIRADDTLQVRGNSLEMTLQDRTLNSTQAFDVRFEQAARRLAIQGLDLAGSMGTLRTEGTADADSADFSLHAALEVPRRLFAFDLPNGSLPERIEIDATAKGSDRLAVTAMAKGLSLGPLQEVNIRLDIEGSGAGLSAHLDAANRLENLLSADASLPVTPRFFPPGIDPLDSPLRLDANIAKLPLPLSTGRGEPVGWAELNGRLSASGTASAPAFEGSASVGFPSVPSLEDYHINIEARSLDEGGLEMELDASLADRSIAKASLRDPTRISLLPFEVVRDSSGIVSLNIRTNELRLQDFSRWFPSGSAAEGDVSAELTAEGHVGNPDLRGRMTTRKMNLKLSDRSRVSARGELRLAGNLRHPELRGEAVIDNGILRLPDSPKNLLPANGQAVLWGIPEFADTGTATAGSSNSAGGPTGSPPVVDPDVDVTLSIPSGLWIRGQGLDVELSGDLALTYREGAPAVTGELAASRGHFIFLGRTFRMESGAITFYGEEEINPALDIHLTINLEGTLVRVTVGGTLLEPQLGFTSEPEMAEGDIMSFLIFGRPLEDLSNNQMDLVQRRAADMVTTFGSAQLEAKLAGQLGVDMVRIRDTRGDKKGSSLVLGKYVSRKVLLEYEQALESNLFFISLDYFLTRHFRLRTLYGQRDQSGMEMNWVNEY